MKKYFPLIPLLLILSSCGKESFIYYRTVPVASQKSYKIWGQVTATKVDVVWIIDNSGSMDSYQRQVMANADVFMKDFIAEDLDWKMGLISTSEKEKPYAGFAGSVQLDSSVKDPAQVFSDAVGELGTSGDSSEKTFVPILNALNNDTSFARKDTPIVFIMVTDAEEQSKMATPSFISALSAKLGSNRPMYVYGVFASQDQGCASEEGSWRYVGSPYEGFIKAAKGGNVYPLCKDFGSTLATIAHQIVTLVGHHNVFLSLRPNVSTLHVFYHGTELPPGETTQGGYWKYDYSLNAIVFNSLSFSNDESDAVQVKFEEDTGV